LLIIDHCGAGLARVSVASNYRVERSRVARSQDRVVLNVSDAEVFSAAMRSALRCTSDPMIP
jgi:hypothetical protein